jgi:hypothetical protein
MCRNVAQKEIKIFVGRANIFQLFEDLVGFALEVSTG